MATTSNGRFIKSVELDLSPAAAITEDVKSAKTYELGDKAVARLFLDVTAVSSGETLDVTLETSADGVTWYSAGTFTQATGTTSERKAFAIDRFIRADFNLTSNGAPSVTCTLRGEAV